VRNDAFEPQALIESGPRALVISPGPGTPSRAGRCIDLIHALAKSEHRVPLLGVCLGHQAIGEAFGARVIRGGVPVHGKVTGVVHRGERLFANCDTPLSSARYHSLVIDRESLPAELLVDAETADGVVMAVSHRDRPIFGIQFHPESYGTTGGDRVILNFLALAGGWQPAAGGEAGQQTPPAASRQPSAKQVAR
jgi:anthranilate synthase component 2